MNHYTIRPLDPLVFGDGRPFSSDPGALAAGGLLLPMPSTLAGAVRTAIGRGQASPDWSALRDRAVHGPLFAVDGTVYAPAPADAVLMANGDALCLVRARPTTSSDGEGTDLPEDLNLVGLPAEASAFEPSKHDPPAWMSVEQLIAWYSDGKLFGSPGQAGVWTVALRNGKPPWDPDRPGGQDRTPRIERDLRVHVGISHETLAAEKGKLFQTTGAAYGDRQTLLVRADSVVPTGVVSLGGERRTACVTKDEGKSWDCPCDVRERLKSATQIAMVLLTPAIFGQGFRPGNLPSTLGAPKLEVVSAVLARREAVSGWDLAKGGPKPVRWLAPAGSVYFLNVPPGDGVQLAECWLHPVSDHPDDRRDGFGLAVFFPTTWGTH